MHSCGALRVTRREGPGPAGAYFQAKPQKPGPEGLFSGVFSCFRCKSPSLTFPRVCASIIAENSRKTAVFRLFSSNNGLGPEGPSLTFPRPGPEKCHSSGAGRRHRRQMQNAVQQYYPPGGPRVRRKQLRKGPFGPERALQRQGPAGPYPRAGASFSQKQLFSGPCFYCFFIY